MLNTILTAVIGDRGNALRQNTFVAGMNPGFPLDYLPSGSDPNYDPTKPLLQLRNTITSGTVLPYNVSSADAQRCLVPWYIRLTVTKAGTGLGSLNVALQTAPVTGAAIGSGGSVFGTAANTFAGANWLDPVGKTTPQAPIGSCIWSPTGLSVAGLLSASGRIVLRNTIPVVGDVYVLSFGEAFGSAGGVMVPAAGQPGYLIIPAPMVQIGRGATLNVLVGAPSMSDGPTFEAEVAWFELKV